MYTLKHTLKNNSRPEMTCELPHIVHSDVFTAHGHLHPEECTLLFYSILPPMMSNIDETSGGQYLQRQPFGCRMYNKHIRPTTDP